MSKVRAGVCPECGVVTGDEVGFRFPDPPYHDSDCRAPLNFADLVDEHIVEHWKENHDT